MIPDDIHAHLEGSGRMAFPRRRAVHSFFSSRRSAPREPSSPALTEPVQEASLVVPDKFVSDAEVGILSRVERSRSPERNCHRRCKIAARGDGSFIPR